jgi:hypothetical protein
VLKDQDFGGIDYLVTEASSRCRIQSAIHNAYQLNATRTPHSLCHMIKRSKNKNSGVLLKSLNSTWNACTKHFPMPPLPTAQPFGVNTCHVRPKAIPMVLCDDRMPHRQNMLPLTYFWLEVEVFLDDLAHHFLIQSRVVVVALVPSVR